MEVAVYKGDTLLCIGTLRECAQRLNVKPNTVYYYTTAAYRRKVNARSRSKSTRIAIIT